VRISHRTFIDRPRSGGLMKVRLAEQRYPLQKAPRAQPGGSALGRSARVRGSSVYCISQVTIPDLT